MSLRDEIEKEEARIRAEQDAENRASHEKESARQKWVEACESWLNYFNAHGKVLVGKYLDSMKRTGCFDVLRELIQYEKRGWRVDPISFSLATGQQSPFQESVTYSYDWRRPENRLDGFGFLTESIRQGLSYDSIEKLVPLNGALKKVDPKKFLLQTPVLVQLTFTEPHYNNPIISMVFGGEKGDKIQRLTVDTNVGVSSVLEGQEIGYATLTKVVAKFYKNLGAHYIIPSYHRHGSDYGGGPR